MESLGTMAQVNWQLVPAGILILFALWIVAALALACSTRLDTIPTLAICSAIFLMGLMSDYFFGRRAAARRLVGFDALQHHPKLAAFLARGCVGHGQEHFSLGLCRQGFWLRGRLRGRGAGRRDGAV